MFVARQIWKLACNNIIQRPQLISAKPLSYFMYGQQSCGISRFFDVTKNYVQPASLLNIRPLLLQKHESIQINQERSVTQYSLRRGKRRTVKNVLKRFYRLDWGIWIRTKCGRHKKLYKKSSARKRRLKEHVFCNGQQSNLLDKMVTKFWKQPKYFVDDPYEPYHKREEFPFTRKIPMK